MGFFMSRTIVNNENSAMDKDKEIFKSLKWKKFYIEAGYITARKEGIITYFHYFPSPLLGGRGAYCHNYLECYVFLVAKVCISYLPKTI